MKVLLVLDRTYDQRRCGSRKQPDTYDPRDVWGGAQLATYCDASVRRQWQKKLGLYGLPVPGC
jgi:hypothetical protein